LYFIDLVLDVWNVENVLVFIIGIQKKVKINGRFFCFTLYLPTDKFGKSFVVTKKVL